MPSRNASSATQRTPGARASRREPVHGAWGPIRSPRTGKLRRSTPRVEIDGTRVGSAPGEGRSTSISIMNPSPARPFRAGWHAMLDPETYPPMTTMSPRMSGVWHAPGGVSPVVGRGCTTRHRDAAVGFASRSGSSTKGPGGDRDRFAPLGPCSRSGGVSRVGGRGCTPRHRDAAVGFASRSGSSTKGPGGDRDRFAPLGPGARRSPSRWLPSSS